MNQSQIAISGCELRVVNCELRVAEEITAETKGSSMIGRLPPARRTRYAELIGQPAGILCERVSCEDHVC